MYRHAYAVDLQTPWECRWTKLGQSVRRCNRRQEQNVIWVCTRAGHRRHVNDAECEACEFWQPPHVDESED